MLCKKHNAAAYDNAMGMVNIPIEDWFDKMAKAEMGDWFDGIGICNSPYEVKRARTIGHAAFEALNAFNNRKE